MCVHAFLRVCVAGEGWARLGPGPVDAQSVGCGTAWGQGWDPALQSMGGLCCSPGGGGVQGRRAASSSTAPCTWPRMGARVGLPQKRASQHRAVWRRDAATPGLPRSGSPRHQGQEGRKRGAGSRRDTQQGTAGNLKEGRRKTFLPMETRGTGPHHPQCSPPRSGGRRADRGAEAGAAAARPSQPTCPVTADAPALRCFPSPRGSRGKLVRGATNPKSPPQGSAWQLWSSRQERGGVRGRWLSPGTPQGRGRGAGAVPKRPSRCCPGDAVLQGAAGPGGRGSFVKGC